MKMIRNNLEIQYLTDMINHNGFRIERTDKYGPINVDALINASNFTDTEYRCDCGAFIGQDNIGDICPACRSEIALHSLNFTYRGWIDLGEHHVITPIYYQMLTRVLGTNMLKFILGDYKSDISIPYDETDTDFYENKKNKKTGRVTAKDINYIKQKIPKSKHQFQGLGHDQFYYRFEEVMLACAPKSHPELQTLLDEKYAVFTTKIPIYSTAFRPVSKTAETMFYPKINKPFSMIAAVQCKLEDMVLDVEKIQALNFIQSYLIEATEHLIKDELSKKTGFARSGIVGGTFCFSGRSVIILDNSLRVDEVDLPASMLITILQYKITRIIATRRHMTLEQAYLYVDTYEEDELVLSILQELIDEELWIYILREPTDNLGSIELCKVRRYKINDDTISVPPDVLSAFNADFDGDQLDLANLPKELVIDFEAFHYSCMTDYVNNKIKIDLKEWNSICLGVMTD